MHLSVLLEECIHYLNLKEDSIVVDMTLGYAGHSSEVLKRIKRGCLFAFDQDNDAIAASKIKLGKIANNFELINSNFVNIKKELKKRNIEKVNAVLFDLGVSSPQLDNAQRGFSFHQDAKLDMRMDRNSQLTAFDVVNNYTREQLIKIFYEYGEEKYSKSIAQNIIEKRQQKLIYSTNDLVEIIKESVPEKYKRNKHPARKVFQAIRIEVNNELFNFKKALIDALDILEVNGRICVITFHSLEDKICKQVFKKYSTIDASLHHLPVVPEKYEPKYKVIAHIKPTRDEIKNNNRARSAKLRVIERIKE